MSRSTVIGTALRVVQDETNYTTKQMSDLLGIYKQDYVTICNGTRNVQTILDRYKMTAQDLFAKVVGELNEIDADDTLIEFFFSQHILFKAQHFPPNLYNLSKELALGYVEHKVEENLSHLMLLIPEITSKPTKTFMYCYVHGVEGYYELMTTKDI